MRRYFRGPFFWVALVVILVLSMSQFLGSGGGYRNADLSKVEQLMASKTVRSVQIKDKEQLVQVETRTGEKLAASFPTNYQDNLVSQARDSGAEKYSASVSRQNPILSILIGLLPIVLVVFLLLFFMNQMQGGGGRVMQFGKSKAKLVSKDMPKTTFSDVAGVDEAIEELQEIKDFLENPAKFQAIGAPGSHGPQSEFQIQTRG